MVSPQLSPGKSHRRSSPTEDRSPWAVDAGVYVYVCMHAFMHACMHVFIVYKVFDLLCCSRGDLWIPHALLSLLAKFRKASRPEALDLKRFTPTLSCARVLCPLGLSSGQRSYCSPPPADWRPSFAAAIDSTGCKSPKKTPGPKYGDEVPLWNPCLPFSAKC